MDCFMIPRRKAIHEPKPLRIEGTHTTMTAEPDDAEMAAMALLASLAGEELRVKSEELPEKGTAAYFHALADRVHEGRTAEVRMAMRYVAYCEQELLRNPQLAELERGLYRHLDTVEREGGELKRRWQRCLAEVTVRLMEEEAYPQPPFPLTRLPVAFPKGGEDEE